VKKQDNLDEIFEHIEETVDQLTDRASAAANKAGKTISDKYHTSDLPKPKPASEYEFVIRYIPTGELFICKAVNRFHGSSEWFMRVYKHRAPLTLTAFGKKLLNVERKTYVWQSLQSLWNREFLTKSKKEISTWAFESIKEYVAHRNEWKKK
jgi:hypothetical protein